MWHRYGMDALKLFGGVTRTRVVVVTIALRETYPREVARVARAPLFSVQRILDELEREGIVASVLSGNQRRVMLNPEWLASDELRALALRLAEVMPEVRAALDAERRRPRRRGKPVDRA
jgi:hypothetical protein